MTPNRKFCRNTKWSNCSQNSTDTIQFYMYSSYTAIIQWELNTEKKCCWWIAFWKPKLKSQHSYIVFSCVLYQTRSRNRTWTPVKQIVLISSSWFTCHSLVLELGLNASATWCSDKKKTGIKPVAHTKTYSTCNVLLINLSYIKKVELLAHVPLKSSSFFFQTRQEPKCKSSYVLSVSLWFWYPYLTMHELDSLLIQWRWCFKNQNEYIKMVQQEHFFLTTCSFQSNSRVNHPTWGSFTVSLGLFPKHLVWNWTD